MMWSESEFSLTFSKNRSLFMSNSDATAQKQLFAGFATGGDRLDGYLVLMAVVMVMLIFEIFAVSKI
jgi:hypothetical protein